MNINFDYNKTDILKIEQLIDGVIEQTELRGMGLGSKFISEVIPKLESSKHALRSIANAIDNSSSTK